MSMIYNEMTKRVDGNRVHIIKEQNEDLFFIDWFFFILSLQGLLFECVGSGIDSTLKISTLTGCLTTHNMNQQPTFSILY